MAGLSVPQCAFADALPAHFFEAQGLGAELDFVGAVGFGAAAFVYDGFQTACGKVVFHHVKDAADAEPFGGYVDAALEADAFAGFGFAGIDALVQGFALCGEEILRPCLFVVD